MVSQEFPSGRHLEKTIFYIQRSVLKNVTYTTRNVKYTSTDRAGTEYLRLAFLPTGITGGVLLARRSGLNAEGYTVRDLGNGDYAVNIRRKRAGAVVISTKLQLPKTNLRIVQ